MFMCRFSLVVHSEIHELAKPECQILNAFDRTNKGDTTVVNTEVDQRLDRLISNFLDV